MQGLDPSFSILLWGLRREGSSLYVSGWACGAAEVRLLTVCGVV